MLTKVNLQEKLARISEHWSPRIVGEANGQHLKLARLSGEFVRHSHASADEVFLVLSGRLEIELDDGTVHLGPGELVVVPAGVPHRPVARDEVEVLLFETAGTVNTGDAGGERTVDAPEWI